MSDRKAKRCSAFKRFPVGGVHGQQNKICPACYAHFPNEEKYRQHYKEKHVKARP